MLVIMVDKDKFKITILRTSEDEYKAKLPILCMGELLEDFTNVLPSTCAKKEHQHQAQAKGLSQRY